MEETDQSKSAFGYVITGLGRSGTTLLAHVFQRAGYDLGGLSSEEIGVGGKPVGGGMEHPDFVRTNMRLQLEVSHLWSDERCEEDSMTAKKLAHRFQNIMNKDWPFILKDPRYTDTARIWFEGGYIPKHVFIGLRNPLQRNASLNTMLQSASEEQSKHIQQTEHSYYSYFSMYQLILFLAEKDIPYTTVIYPRIGNDRLYAERILSPFIENPWEVIQEVWEEKLHHHRGVRG